MFSKRLIGIDIGSQDLKLVELQRSGGSVRLIAAERVRLVDSVDSATMIETAEDAVRAFLSSRGRAPIVCSVPPQDVTEKIVDLPPTDLDTVEDVMRFEAETHIPLPLEAVYYDHVVVRSDEKATGVLLAACPRRVVNALNSALQKAGAKKFRLATPCVALINALRHAASDGSLATASGLLLADIGARHTQVVVTSNGQPHLIRAIPIGSDGLTEALRHDWALSHEAAETRKNERGLATDEDLTPAAQTWLDRFADELRRVMQGFRAATRTGTIERVVLTGSGALTIGFAERLTELVGVPTQLLPLEDSITASVGSLAATGRESVGFATAIGLALSADSGAIAVNLQPMQGSKREIARLLPRPLVLGLTAGVIAAVVIITAGLQSLNAEKAEKLEGLQKTLKASQNQTKGSDSATLAQKRVAALKKLDGEVRSDATRWLDVMRQLSAQLPDRVSIVEIVMEKQRTVAVRAMTETNDQVADSLRIVRSFSDFTDVRLDYATETLIEGQPVVEFQLLCRLPAPPVRRVQR